MKEPRAAASKSQPARKPLAGDHELFTEGNLARGLHAEQMMLEVMTSSAPGFHSCFLCKNSVFVDLQIATWQERPLC